MKIFLLAMVMLSTFRATAAAPGGDTPFLSYECTYGRPSEDRIFLLRLHNDSVPEILEWKSPLSRTVIRFEKNTKESVQVYIKTGAPVVAHVSPEEFRFTAPLTTESFDFAMGMRPLSFKGGDVLNLVCVKGKSEE
jgi:hypothetical protein